MNDLQYSTARQDAIKFLEKVMEFRENNFVNITQYFNDLGFARSLRLNNFLREINLVSLVETFIGLTPSLKSQIIRISNEDINKLLKDVKDGKYDSLFN